MKTNFLIPALAFVSAIGMSFTTATQQDPMNDYIQRNGQWEQIQEVTCENGSEQCQVILDGEGPFTVYDEENNLVKGTQFLIVCLSFT